MNEDLHKRLEKAADIYAKRIWDNLMEVHISKKDFLAGAELGYKEAIEMAKEWIARNFYLSSSPRNGLYDYWDCDFNDSAELIDNFEVDMIKLLEEKK